MSSRPEPAGAPSTKAVSLDPPRSTRRRWMIPVGIALGWLPRVLAATYRLVGVRGREHLDALVDGGGPAILVAWHNRLFVCGDYLLKNCVRRGYRIAVLSSLSRDGEIFSRVAARAGFEVIRGSTTRGGKKGLRRLYRALTREKISVGTAPDGPHGPVYECKPGTIILAQVSGAPIVPMSYAARRFYRLPSWDRLIVPRPFTRVAIAIGEPITIPAELPAEEFEASSKRLGERLHALTREAEACLEQAERA